MTPEQPDFAGQLQARASDLLKNLLSRRLDFEEASRQIGAISVPPSLAVAWYRALGQAAAPVHPELGLWANRKAREAGDRGSDLLARLQASHLDMGDMEAADRLDPELCLAYHAEDKPAGMIAPLRRISEAFACRPEGDPFPLGASPVGAALAAARAEGREEDYLAVRKGLRQWLGAALQAGAGRDYNLVLLDLDSPGGAGPSQQQRVDALVGLFAEPRLALREALGAAAPLVFLIRVSGAVHRVEGDRAVRLVLDEEAFRFASEAAHFSHAPFDGRSAAGASVPMAAEALPGWRNPSGGADAVRREQAFREGRAVEQGTAMVPILAGVMGLQGFDHPEVRTALEQIREGAAKLGRTGVNSEPGYGKLVSLFCMTNGLTSDFLSFLIRLYNPPYPIVRCEGILGRLEARDLSHIAETLRRDGIYRFPQTIPADLLEDLIRHGRNAPCYPHPESGVEKDPVIYPEGDIRAVKYDFVERELVPTRPVQRILADEGLLAVSQAYFGAKPIIDAVAMWWSTNFAKAASSEAAQLYHFDLERIRWLKWFIYLTDVDAGTGPHCFVRGSHRTGSKPARLLQRGYQRISDEEMASCFPKEDLLELTGPKGSIFVEDTSGFHKGKHPSTGNRLVIEFEYTNSLYGAPLVRESGFGGGIFPPLLAMAGRYPQVYCKYALRP